MKNDNTVETQLQKAIQIAEHAHAGQKDKAGAPYIHHPMRVMKMGRTLEEKIVGVLHDVVEDTDVTFDDLALDGFGEEIIAALRCITKTSDDEDYDVFIERCAANPLATAVKIHDLTDNMDLRRLPAITDNTVVRMKKYLKAYHRLLPLYDSRVRKKILYIDMDGVLVDYQSGLDSLDAKTRDEYDGHLDDVPDMFSRMKPIPGAIEAYRELSDLFDTYILSTSPWGNPTALSDKKEWVKSYIGDIAKKRIIFSHHKDLNRGDFLVDDRTFKGAASFEGELIRFGSADFPDWNAVVKYLKTRR